MKLLEPSVNVGDLIQGEGVLGGGLDMANAPVNIVLKIVIMVTFVLMHILPKN